MIERKINEDAAGQRLDKYVRRLLKDVPLSHVFKMFRTRKVKVNGARGRPEYLLQAGDVIEVRGEEQKLLAAPPAAVKHAPALPREPLKILYEDNAIMAIDKQPGMAVHPGSGITTATLVDVVRAYLGPKAVRNEFTASPAHRLDRDTSGVILVAKTRRAMVRFTEMFTEGSSHKSYLTLAKGQFSMSKGVVDLPLAEHEQSGKSKSMHGTKMQEALTRWRVLGKGEVATLLECKIETGRTHQIRRHLVAIGHPVAGDARHGDFPYNRELRSRFGLKRMFLHARSIRFAHPITGEQLSIEAPLPPELVEVLEKMGISLPEKGKGE